LVEHEKNWYKCLPKTAVKCKFQNRHIDFPKDRKKVLQIEESVSDDDPKRAPEAFLLPMAEKFAPL